LFVGTLEPRKNLAGLLGAFERLDRADLDLVIVGPQGWQDGLPHPSASIADRVRLLGFVDADDLPALYEAAEVCCQPSLLEGFGLPVLEALAQGTPVVTSAGTSTEEVLGDAGLAVDPTDTDRLAEALGEMLDDVAAHRDAWSERARRRAAEFSWDRAGEALEDVYREVI
jgi:glycosyltransferase involved in cell wall biosynthesis